MAYIRVSSSNGEGQTPSNPLINAALYAKPADFTEVDTVADADLSHIDDAVDPTPFIGECNLARTSNPLTEFKDGSHIRISSAPNLP
jgi:hypothetical protein